MENKKKENPIKKIMENPLSTPPSTINSSISPSTETPALSVPSDPEIPVSEKELSQHNATAVDGMMLGLAEKNLQTTQEDASPKTLLEERIEHAQDLGIETNLTAKEATPNPEDEKEKRMEENAVDNVNLLFPGLKKIGKILGLFTKKKEDSRKKEE